MPTVVVAGRIQSVCVTDRGKDFTCPLFDPPETGAFFDYQVVYARRCLTPSCKFLLMAILSPCTAMIFAISSYLVFAMSVPFQQSAGLPSSRKRSVSIPHYGRLS